MRTMTFLCRIAPGQAAMRYFFFGGLFHANFSRKTPRSDRGRNPHRSGRDPQLPAPVQNALGGSVDLAMLPIIVFCVRWGFGPGMIVAFAHSLLQTMFEGGIAIGWQSILGDFVIAYSVLGLAGLFKGKFYLATIVACVARFLVHYVVGATIWAEYMPETFFNMTMTSPWIYSALYNAAYMLVDMLAILLVGFILMKTPAKKYLLGTDLAA